MAGRIQHAHLEGAELERVAFADLLVDAGHLGGLATRADDRALGVGLEGQVAGGVVAVVMGGEDMREPPALGPSQPRPLWHQARRSAVTRARHRGSTP
jgi:hypothetical protein